MLAEFDGGTVFGEFAAVVVGEELEELTEAGDVEVGILNHAEGVELEVVGDLLVGEWFAVLDGEYVVDGGGGTRRDGSWLPDLVGELETLVVAAEFVKGGLAAEAIKHELLDL